MNNTVYWFATVGMCTCFYAIARLLHYFTLRLEDENKHEILQKALIVLCVVLWILSFPVAVVLYFLNKFHTDRLRLIIKKELSPPPPKSPPVQNPVQRSVREPLYNYTTADGDSICVPKSQLDNFISAQKRIQEERKS